MTAEPVLRQPHRDRRQPRVKRTAGFICIEVSEGTNERVLRHLFGPGRFPDHHQHQAEQPALIGVDQVRERFMVSALDLANDFLVRTAHALGCSGSSTRPSPMEA